METIRFNRPQPEISCSLIRCIILGHVLPMRYWITFILFCGLFGQTYLQTTYYFMTSELLKAPPNEGTVSCKNAQKYRNQTLLPEATRELNWSPLEINLSKVLYYAGYVVSTIPAGAVSDTMGGRSVMAVSVFFTALSSVTLPFVLQSGYFIAASLVTLAGIAQGMYLPATASILSTWAPQEEITFLVVIVMSASQLANFFAYGITGGIIEYMPTGYRYSGPLMVSWIFTIPQVVCHLFYVFNHPLTHPFVSDLEKKYLTRVIPFLGDYIPWGEMVHDVFVWGMAMGHFAHDWFYNTMYLDLPKIMSDLYFLSMEQLGHVISILWFFMFMSTLFVSFIANLMFIRKLYFLPIRRACTVIGNFFPPLLVTLGLLIGPCNERFVLIMLYSAFVLKGFAYPGALSAHFDETRAYAGSLYALFNVFTAVSGALTPLVDLFLTINDVHHAVRWTLVMYVSLAISVGFTLVYVFLSTDYFPDWDE